MAEPEKAYACNCSICSRVGWLLAFVSDEAFEIASGEDALTDYQFGEKRAHHVFCRSCGVRAFSRGTDAQGRRTVAVNLRCVTDLDVSGLPVETFDGASL